MGSKMEEIERRIIMNKENKIKFGTVIAVVTVGYVGYLSARYLNKKLNIVNNIKKLINK